ncbi:ribosome 60S biogenesis N-terminal-domain-containing protein, partial [Dissophora ornata]
GLKRLRQQLNVRPNSSDPSESAQATKSLGVVYAYVEESPECTELLKIWEWQQQHDLRRIEAPIVEVLSKLIHQCNTALHRGHAIKLTRSILQNQGRMTVVYKNLSSGRQNTVQATLRLLTAMNHVHHTTTRELKDGFNFSLKILSKLKNQRRKEGDEAANKADTRTLYIQFLLSFFVRGDATVKKEVLEMPDLFQAALKDLYNDSLPLIKQVLSVLINNIVMDNELPRTTKISFFSTSFLINQLKLYARTEPIPNSDQTVAQVVHGFMMALCTTPGVGICFQDAAWYPPSTLNSTTSVENTSEEGAKHIFNKTLSQLLTHLRPTENILQQELTVSILTACPELVRIFWQKASMQMEPRLSARWLANMTFLHKITEIPVPNLYLQNTGLFASHPPPVSTVIENILPSAVNRAILSKGLQHPSMLVRYFTIIELAAAFQKTEQVIAVMQSAVKTLAAADAKIADPPAQQWAGAITLLLAELRRRVPDIQIIISLHNGIQSVKLAEVDEEEKTRLDLFNNGVLRLIKYYQQFLPQAVSESKFDVGKLIPSDFSTVQAGTLIHLLELLLALNDFRWSNKSLDGSSSHLSKLLSLFLTTVHPQIKVLTRRLISKLLGESILFQHDPSEATLWVEAISASNYGRPDLTAEQTAFLHFLDDSVARCLKTPYKYVDQSSAILKALQRSLAASNYQNFAQSFSPLLMTMLEQFQYVYAKEASKVTSRSISALLHRLLPALICNQNRTSALAVECLNRIQDPTKRDIEKVLKLSLEKRKQITELGVVEYLAITSESLQEGSILESSHGNESKAAGGLWLQELKASDHATFVAELHQQSAMSISTNFKRVVEYAKTSYESRECLLDYLRTRHPFAGSIYAFPDVAALMKTKHQLEDLEQDTVHGFLKKLPFPVLFNNAMAPTVSNAFIQGLLMRSVKEAEPRHLTLFSSLIIHRLAAWIQSGDADEASVIACFSLLTSLLEASQSHENISTEFKNKLWEQYILHELYLYQPQGGKSKTKHMDTLDSQIVDLLVASMKSTTALASSKVSAANLLLASHYVHLTMLLQSILGLHRQAKFSATATFNALLSTILRHLTQQGGSTSAIPVQSTAALLDLWKEQPSEELDAIVLELEGHCAWSVSASEQDRQSVKALQPILLPKLAQYIANHHSSSGESIMVADTAAIFISLTTDPEDEDEVASVWELIESIPHIGLESITLLSSLLDVTNGLTSDQEQLDRQARLARWFEEAARRLIVALDKSGDAEWLEPVCDRLHDMLEQHVMERKLDIDQKVLFELVSFAIEKALDNVELIRFSACLAKYYYIETTQSSVLPQILQTLFKHRQFSSLVMATAPTTKHMVPDNVRSRLAIIQLIYTLTSLEPETCCKAGFLPTLLASYSASTSVADQLVLSVLRITEAQTAGSISNRAPLWGSAAENTKASSALFGQAMINESLDLIDPNVMMISVLQFPFDRELEFSAPLVQRQAPTYDPCFMLPLFGTYMAFGNLLDCRRLIEVNGLGLIVVALSSVDDNMRFAAYSLLDDFYGIISNATMREKNQLLLLLDSLKNSIVDREDSMAPPRIPAVITTFVAHALASLLRPDHFMYPHINKFCLQRPTIDLEDIPMFYSMFNSSSEQHRKERVWMLRLLATSLKTADDYKLFKRRHVVDLLVAFFNSQLSEPLSRKIVIEVLFNASAIPKASLQLITQSAFLSWLHTLTATNAMSSDNEFSLVPARLLLRVIQSCPKESIRWMNGTWKNQVAGIATTMIRQLSRCLVHGRGPGRNYGFFLILR